MKKARPHPNPLPRGEGTVKTLVSKIGSFSRSGHALDDRSRRTRKPKAHRLSRRREWFSLSPGERVGVRANHFHSASRTAHPAGLPSLQFDTNVV